MMIKRFIQWLFGSRPVLSLHPVNLREEAYKIRGSDPHLLLRGYDGAIDENGRMQLKMARDLATISLIIRHLEPELPERLVATKTADFWYGRVEL